jgi:hypothetical protein
MIPRFAFAALAILSAAPAGPRDPSAARGRAREVLKSARCDACHDSGVSAENRAALAVYDLVEPGWPARMSDGQLPKLLTRLKSAPAADQKAVREFIALELKKREAERR